MMAAKSELVVGKVLSDAELIEHMRASGFGEETIRRWTAPRRARERHIGVWHVVHCVGKPDAHALDWLDRLKFETYYPMLREMKPVPRDKLSKKQRMSGMRILAPKLVPAFPRYIFVRLDMEGLDWQELRAIAGIGGIVCEGNLPVQVADAEIARFRGEEVDGALQGEKPVREFFKIGGLVRVIDGPFASFNGTVEELLDKPVGEIDADTRIKVALHIFGRPTPVTLDLRQVEKV